MSERAGQELLKKVKALHNMNDEEVTQEYIKMLRADIAQARGVAKRLLRKLKLTGKCPRDWPEGFTFLGRHIDWLTIDEE